MMREPPDETLEDVTMDVYPMNVAGVAFTSDGKWAIEFLQEGMPIRDRVAFLLDERHMRRIIDTYEQYREHAAAQRERN